MSSQLYLVKTQQTIILYLKVEQTLCLYTYLYRLKEIAAVINEDLIAQTFKLNGWTDTELPKIAFSDFDEQNIDEFGKIFTARCSRWPS